MGGISQHVHEHQLRHATRPQRSILHRGEHPWRGCTPEPRGQSAARAWSRNSVRRDADSLAIRARSSAAVLQLRTALMRSRNRMEPPKIEADIAAVAPGRRDGVLNTCDGLAMRDEMPPPGMPCWRALPCSSPAEGARGAGTVLHKKTHFSFSAVSQRQRPGGGPPAL